MTTGGGAQLLELLLPAVVQVQTLRRPPGHPGLFPQEHELIAKAVAKRREEFAAVRFCARKALRRLGFTPSPILTGDAGAPLWPEGVVGSMTHCAGYYAAAVARAGEVTSLGIDAELDEPLPTGVFEVVARSEEIADLRPRMTGAATVHWDRLLFSAKESLYKTWYPIARRWLDFTEARITLRPDGTFTAELLVDPLTVGTRRISHLDGRWANHGGILVTAITLP